MKIKTIVLGWIFMSFSQVVISQVSFGVQGGISFFRETQFNIPSNLYDYDLEDRFTDGYYVALITDIPIKNNFSIQTELSLIRKGRAQIKKDKLDPLSSDFGWRQENRYQFIEVPLLAKYHVNISEQLGFELGLGASVGYMLQYKYWLRQNSNATSTILELPKPCANCYPVNRWDISPLLDMSFQIEAPFGEFIAGFRGSMDLKKLRGSFYFEDQEYLLGKSYNWGMMVYTGYSINKKHFKKSKSPKSEFE